MTLMRLYQRNGNPAGNEDATYRYSDMLRDFFGNDAYSASAVSPRTNISERKDAYELEIALPGLTKKDIRMEVNKNVLSVSPSKKEDIEENGNYHRREFEFRNFCRSFRLPETVNSDAISARMENGILRITLPKKEEAVDKGPREINIS